MVLCDDVPVSEQPPGGSGPLVDESAETFCYNHRGTPASFDARAATARSAGAAPSLLLWDSIALNA